MFYLCVAVKVYIKPKNELLFFPLPFGLIKIPLKALLYLFDKCKKIPLIYHKSCQLLIFLCSLPLLHTYQLLDCSKAYMISPI